MQDRRQSELEVMRHYQHLASLNFGVDTGMYPLGSCTMKYNPRINEDMCRLDGFAQLHPTQPTSSVQGALQLIYELQRDLAEIAGFAATTLQPAAGAHGEYAALMVFRAALRIRGDVRKTVIIPDTAHGTNPATVTLCGYDVVSIPSNDKGLVDLDALTSALNEDVAAFMLTNPNTLGLFEAEILEITQAVHDVGAYCYCDGANLNALLGIARPGDMGFDALHINLHKTFSTPHGGGGPGAGPVCVTAELADFLPGPIAAYDEQTDIYSWHYPDASIGRVKTWYGNFGVLVRAYTYIKMLGAQGLRDAAEQAIISANYLRVHMQDLFRIPFNRACMHEFVMSDAWQKRDEGVSTLDMAKRLLDYGFHPPTIYFPLLVEGAMMVEPTETEPLDKLDEFIGAMKRIVDEAKENPEMLHDAPYHTPVRRLDEAGAARNVDVTDLE